MTVKELREALSKFDDDNIVAAIMNTKKPGEEYTDEPQGFLIDVLDIRAETQEPGSIMLYCEVVRD